MKPTHHLLTPLPCLDTPTCQHLCQQIDALREHWLQRHPDYPYFTLGAASYLDAANNPAEYSRLAQRFNPLLAQHFGDLLTQVQHILSTHTGEDFTPAPEAALPGFHIFDFHPAFRRPLASIHVDEQYRDVPWQEAEPDQRDPLSFTLPLCLPASGGGLNVWNIPSPTQRLLPPEFLVRGRDPTYVPYQTGVLMLHSGHLLHQIAPIPEMQPGDRRITLQGHALRRGGVYQLYW